MRGGMGSDDSTCAKATVDEGRGDGAIERESESKLL
jgi:hypothetical protein